MSDNNKEKGTVRTVLQVGARKQGVPTREEMYKALKNRSIELQSSSAKK